MSYIGSTPTSQNFTSGTDYFSGTGSQTTFTLTRTVNSVNDIEVVINNVVQQPSTAYTLSGTTITFTSAPSSGTNNIYVRYLATNMQSFAVPANSIGRNQLTSDLQAGFQGRNRIINGHMVVDQRNAGASVTNLAGALTFSVDRFPVNCSAASKFTMQQNAGSVTPPPGFSNYLGLTSTSSYSSGTTDYFHLYQPIEGYNIADFNWGTANAKTVTISFWVRASVTGTYGGIILNSSGTANYPFTYTITSANTWQYITFTVVGPTFGTWNSTNGTGLEFRFDLGTGSTYTTGTAGAWSSSFGYPSGTVKLLATNGGTLYITGLQLEEGTTATSFEREAYSITLQKCQRYYFRNTPLCSTTYAAVGTGYFSTTGNLNTYFKYPVTMRSQPTFNYSNITVFGSSTGGAASVTSVSGSYAGYDTGLFTLNTGTTSFAAGGGGIASPNTTGSTSYVEFSAEL